MGPTSGTHCRSCGQEVGGAFCGGVRLAGACRTGGSAPRHDPAVAASCGPGRRGDRRRRAAGRTGAYLLDRDEAPVAPPDPTAQPGPPPPAAATGRVVTASCARAASRDAAGRPTSYEPERALDGDPTTAWRCDGTGVGQWLTVTFPTPVRISAIGVVPGLAKTDPGDGTDRYAQNRRIAAVRVMTDDGRAVDARLDTSPDDRAAQTVGLGDPVTTRALTVAILDSASGTEQNGQAAVDSVAIAELTWS